MFASIVLGQFLESETGDDVRCTCENLGDDSHTEVERDTSVKIAKVLVFGKIDEEAVGEPHSDEWRCYGDSVEEPPLSRFHIYDLYHEHGKDDEYDDEDGREECDCGFALRVQNEWIFGFAGFDSAIDTKAHPSKTNDAYALKNRAGYWAWNEDVSVVNVRSYSSVFQFRARNAYTLVSNPRHMRVNGERPMEMQTIEAVYTPVDGCDIAMSWQIAPTRRQMEKVMRRTQPELLANP